MYDGEKSEILGFLDFKDNKSGAKDNKSGAKDNKSGV